MSYIYDLTDTWNAAGTVFTSIKMNVTNSASANGSKLIDLQIGGVSLFNVDKSGGVGIGTTTPSTSLYVFGGGGGINSTFDSSTAADTRMEFRNNGTRAGYIYWDSSELRTFADTARSITLYAGSSERMRITSAGNVGIGITTPASRLQINSATGDASGIRLQQAGWPYSTRFGAVGTSGDAQYWGLNFNFASSTVDSASYYTTYISQNVGFSTITFGTSSAVNTAPTERLRITSTGDVGIGTSSPTAKLDVNGQLNVPDQLAYDFTTSVLPDIAPTLNLNFVGANAVDPRITFTRSTTATYYDAETTALAEQNLLLYSQEFDNAAWQKADATLTANTSVAPDGTTTADTLTGNGVNIVHYTRQIVAGGYARMFSVYLKAGTNNFAQIYFDGDAAPWANFDLSAGTVGATGSNQTATITSVGSGWYRCQIYTNSLTASNPTILLVTSASVGRYENNTLTTSILLWGAQLEQRATATAYTATTNAPITNYIPQLMTAAINQPRLDFSPTTRAPRGLLIEESRTNLLTYSEQFDNAAWTKTNASITANAVTSPDGTINADKIIPTTANADHLVRQTVTVTNATHTYTVCAKADGYGFLAIQIASDAFYTKYFEGVFNLTTGAVEGTGRNVTYTGSRSITSLGNGWYRCQIVVNNIDANSTTIATALPLSTNNPAATYAGNGFSGTFIWGAQLEVGSFATSYIPTVATTVARGGDQPVMSGANATNWFNQSEGTFVFDADVIAPSVGSKRIVGVNATAASFGFVSNTSVYGAFDGTAALTANTVSANTAFKASTAYDATNKYVVLNAGSLVTVARSATFPLTPVSTLQLGWDSSAPTNALNGHIRSIRYYPTRLANATLQALTA